MYGLTIHVSKKKPPKSKGKFVTRRAAHAAVRAPHGVAVARVEGRVDAHPDGHGFLGSDDGSLRVFLPAAEMRQVLHGDRARARIIGEDHRGRPIGEITEVLERAHLRIVGRLHAEHGVLFLVPSDRRIVQRARRLQRYLTQPFHAMTAQNASRGAFSGNSRYAVSILSHAPPY